MSKPGPKGRGDAISPLSLSDSDPLGRNGGGRARMWTNPIPP
jgi:hypothetical protein